jgi:hypothetical protein
VKSRRNHLSHLFLFTVPILLLGVGLLAYNILRFGSPLETGYHFAPGQEGFTTPLWWGLSGLLISPARGLLWYSPPVVLGVAGWVRWQRQERPFAWLVLAIISGQLVVFSLWWEWWGGYGWGPRFLLPIVPLLLVCSLPVLETAVRGNRWTLAIVILLGGVGLWVQGAGTAVDTNVYEQTLEAQFPAAADQPLRYHHDSTLVYDLARSPIVAHWQAIIRGEWQPFWWQKTEVTRLPTIPAIIRAEQRPGEAFVFLEPTLLYDVLAARDLPPSFGLPTNIAVDDSLAHRLWEHALADASGVWLVTWYESGSPANWYEADLRQHWASLSETWADDLRLLHMARPVEGGRETAVSIPFGSITLTNYQIVTNQDTLFITLQWQAAAPIAEDYINFIQLLADDGTILAQQDRQPWGGYRPTSGWQIGETIIDRFAFPLQEQAQDARIIVGWYSWPDLKRLPVTLENNEAADFYEVSRDPFR